MNPIEQAIEALEELVEYAETAGFDWSLDNARAALAALRSMPAEPVALTDGDLERVFEVAGGKWNGDYWLIEDADFHPAMRSLISESKATPPPAPVLSDAEERAAFEAWCEAHLMPAESDWFNREPDEPDEYRNPMIDMAWAAWQNRAGRASRGAK